MKLESLVQKMAYFSPRWGLEVRDPLLPRVMTAPCGPQASQEGNCWGLRWASHRTNEALFVFWDLTPLFTLRLDCPGTQHIWAFCIFQKRCHHLCLLPSFVQNKHLQSQFNNSMIIPWNKISSSFLFNLFIFNWRIITLYILCWFLPYISMN